MVVLKGGGKEPNWKNAKAMMSDTGFLRSLVEFDKDSLGDRQIKTVNNTLKQSSLSPEDVKNVSQAAAGLLKWVFASEYSPFPPPLSSNAARLPHPHLVRQRLAPSLLPSSRSSATHSLLIHPLLFSSNSPLLARLLTYSLLTSTSLPVVNYYAVAKTVDPKRKAVAANEKALRASQKELSKIQAEVQQLSAQLLELKEKYDLGSAEEKELAEKAATMERRLTAASKLIAGLGSERVRWTADMETLHNKREVPSCRSTLVVGVGTCSVRYL